MSLLAPLQASLELQYMAFVATASLVALVAGTYAFLPDATPASLVKEFLRTDWRYLGVAWLVTVFVNELAHYRVDTMFTPHIYDIEGAAVATFQIVTTTPLTVFFTVVYLVGFPFVVLFTYFKLKHHDEEQAHRYALAYVALVLLAAPFFLLFPVRVSGHVLSDVNLLLFDVDPAVRAGMAATDTLVKAFPSLHTGLSVLAALYARKTDATYERLAWAIAVSVALSTLYLGVHWLTDAAFAVALVLVAYWLSQRVEDPDRAFLSSS